MKHLHSVLAGVLLVGAHAGAQAPRCYDFRPVDALMNGTVSSLRLRGASLSLEKEGVRLYHKAFGGYTLGKVVPIASASKWIAGVLVMSQVDDGRIRLDDPLSKWFGSLPGEMGKATIRQCMSHTAGFDGWHPAISNRRLTLAQAAAQITKTPLRYKPGSSFHYGGVSMQMVGRVLELASKKDLETLLRERILKPMGITTIDFQGLGKTKNYRMAAGMRASLDDYATVLRMILNGGMHGNRRILSRAAIQEMLRDQTNGAVIRYTPQPDSRRYGIGVWRDRIDARGTILQASSQGAFGFSPWIDFERNVVGVFLVVNLIRRVAGPVNTLQAWTRAKLDPAGVLCFGRGSRSCSGTIATHASGIPTSGLVSFALTSSKAPPHTGGALLISAIGRTKGLPLLGAELWVGLSPALLLPSVTDNLGNARVAVPLAISRDTRLYTQFAWLSTASCGKLGQLATSWGLELRVQ